MPSVLSAVNNIKRIVSSEPTKGRGGNLGWRFLHTIAQSYPVYPTPTEKINAMALVNAVIDNLQCAECRVHAHAYVGSNPPVLTDRVSFMKWVFDFHNAVNRRLGKRQMTWTEYLGNI